MWCSVGRTAKRRKVEDKDGMQLFKSTCIVTLTFFTARKQNNGYLLKSVPKWSTFRDNWFLTRLNNPFPQHPRRDLFLVIPKEVGVARGPRLGAPDGKWPSRAHRLLGGEGGGAVGATPYKKGPGGKRTVLEVPASGAIWEREKETGLTFPSIASVEPTLPDGRGLFSSRPLTPCLWRGRATLRPGRGTLIWGWLAVDLSLPLSGWDAKTEACSRGIKSLPANYFALHNCADFRSVEV